MESENLVTAVLGLNEIGRCMLAAAASTGLFTIKAVADLDQQNAEKAAQEYGCTAFTDYRQLVVQNQLDCLLVAAETHTCDEQIKTAIKRKFHVLKASPPARTFAEALEFVELAQAEHVQFAVANPSRFWTGSGVARDLLAQGRLGHVFLIAISCTFNASDRRTWQIDPQVAGGGLLLHDCYPVLDQILQDFPVPAQVYALKTNHAPDKQQRLCLTEDAAVVAMRFNDALMGSLVASRNPEVRSERIVIEIHGRKSRLTIADSQLVVSGDNLQDQRWQYEESRQVLMERLLAGFAQNLRAPEQHPFPGAGVESLKNMAVLESIYLSARTGFPEEPARILRMTGGPASTIASV
ncbi:MAG TPA: Gfo/Idh/MocA family oxidoreductase [Sedimentisphaerales bacterium]|nr:Gfo/Idh/MocA family oxidoreductase [Sedimentisphaerales bacterium]HQG48212.1 Gfo/Idh/MocA family oxidoreductase [Sedimentisphaerales bacterium]HQI27140.1 Gfo/Idh/MocA family oxidoreductase [Sedimentisphaerales bacterium]